MRVLEILKPIAARMPLYVKLMYMLYSDPAISKRRKAYLSAALLYTISPIDLVPGFANRLRRERDRVDRKESRKGSEDILPAVAGQVVEWPRCSGVRL